MTEPIGDMTGPIEDMTQEESSDSNGQTGIETRTDIIRENFNIKLNIIPPKNMPPEENGKKYIRLLNNLPKDDNIQTLEYNGEKYVLIDKEHFSTIAATMSHEMGEGLSTEEAISTLQQITEIEVDSKEELKKANSVQFNGENCFTEQDGAAPINDIVKLELADVTQETTIEQTIKEAEDIIESGGIDDVPIVPDEDIPNVTDWETAYRIKKTIETYEEKGIHPQVALIGTNSGAMALALLIPGVGFAVMGAALVANLKILPKFPSVSIKKREKRIAIPYRKPKQSPTPPKPTPEPGLEPEKNKKKFIERRTDKMTENVDVKIDMLKSDKTHEVYIPVFNGMPKKIETLGTIKYVEKGKKIIELNQRNLPFIAKAMAIQSNGDLDLQNAINILEEQADIKADPKFNLEAVNLDFENLEKETDAVDLSDVLKLTVEGQEIKSTIETVEEQEQQEPDVNPVKDNSIQQLFAKANLTEEQQAVLSDPKNNSLNAEELLSKLNLTDKQVSDMSVDTKKQEHPLTPDQQRIKAKHPEFSETKTEQAEESAHKTPLKGQNKGQIPVQGGELGF